MKLFIFLLLTLVTALQAAASEFTLVDKGRPKAAIIVEHPDNPTTALAGRELQEHIAKRTGALLPIVSPDAPVPEGLNPIYLGLSRRTEQLGAVEQKIGPDGFFIGIHEDCLIIAGRDKPQVHDPINGHDFVIGNDKEGIYALGEAGTANGVYHFLRKYAGIRWYMPGDLGTIIPQNESFSVPVSADWYEAPAFMFRHLHGLYMRNAKPESLYWYRRLCAGAAQNIYINHSYSRIFHKFKDTHPEYFALIDGQRDLDNLSTANHFGNLCLSNPDVAKEFAVLANEFFDSVSDVLTFPLVPQDGMFKMCECENCRKLYSPHLGENGKFSNGVFYLASEVAKLTAQKHPDRYIGTLAYEGHQSPPEIDLPRNLHVRICYQRKGFRNPELKARTRHVIASYHSKGVPISIWTYGLEEHIPPYRGIPIFTPELLQEDYRFCRDNGVIGEFSESTFYSGGGDQYVHDFDFALMGLAHLNMYIQYRLLWNPDIDLQEELEEYYRLFYGPAAEDMKAFWSFASEKYLAGSENNPLNQYTGEELETFFTMARQALGKCQPDSPEAKRIQLLLDEMTPFLIPLIQELSYKKIFSVPMLKHPVKLDDAPDSGLWRHASVYKLKRKDGREADDKYETTLYSLASKQGLALCCTAREPELDKLCTNVTKRDDPNAWLDDCLELYLISEDRTINLLYIITANGIIFDDRLNENMNIPGDLSWNSPMQPQIIKKNGYIIWTMMIPWSDLRHSGSKLPRLRFQLYRRRTGGDPENGDYYALFPVNAPANYSPELFAELAFLKPIAAVNSNGSFEILSPGNAPRGWQQNGYKFHRNDGQASNGKNCIETRIGDTPPLDYIQTEKLFLKPGSDYRFNLMNRGAGGVAYMLCFDENGRQLSEPNRVCFYLPGGPEWHLETCSGRIPEGTAYAHLAFRSFENAKDGSGMLVDDVQLFGQDAQKTAHP